jgi:hypothetical protein
MSIQLVTMIRRSPPFRDRTSLGVRTIKLPQIWGLGGVNLSFCISPVGLFYYSFLEHRSYLFLGYDEIILIKNI